MNSIRLIKNIYGRRVLIINNGYVSYTYTFEKVSLKLIYSSLNSGLHISKDINDYLIYKNT